MKDRLQEILKKEHLTPARFAELVGVQRSSVSHILSGRNNPSLDFLQKILASFEHINPDWLITGNGPYKRSDLFLDKTIKDKNTESNGQIYFPVNEPVKDEQQSEYMRKKSGPVPNLKSDKPENGKFPVINSSDSIPHKKIIKTILIYDDNTFDIFFPA